MPQNLDDLSPVQYFRYYTEPQPPEQFVQEAHQATDELAGQVPADCFDNSIPRDGGDESFDFPDRTKE